MSYPRTKLYIAKFGKHVGRREIQETFGKYGEVSSCNVNERDGYATVTYRHEEQAEKAISKLNGSDSLGGNLLVEHTLKKRRDDDGYSRPPRDDRYGGSGYRDQNGYRGSRYGDRGGDRGGDRDRGSSFRSGTRGPPREDKERFIRDGLCYTCGQQGHISRKCPEARPGGRGRDSGGRSDRDRRSYRERSRSFDRNKDKRKENRSRSPHDKYDRDRRRDRKHSKRSSSSSSRSNKSESKSKKNRKRSASSSKSSRTNSNSSRSASSNHRSKNNGDKNYGNSHDQKKDTSSQH